MKFGSLFDGIYGFGLGLERAGMECAWVSEIDKNCNALMERRRPNIPNLGDVRNVAKRNAKPVDVVCGGFPCQDLSVAGKRAGLAGERSGLWFQFHRVLASLEPRWVVVENVPGLLSSNSGRDFAVIVRGLVELGYGVAWRVLDAQYFGVPQRRRRVFIVGCLGDGRAAQVLFEPESLSGNPPPSREEGAHVANSIAFGSTTDHGDASQQHYIAQPLRAGRQYSDMGDGQSNVIAFGGIGESTPKISENIMPTLRSAGDNSGEQHQFVGGTFGVRRLTPLECERLQGFPDGWTEGFADSVRYRMLGNAVAVPVVEWIAKRIAALQEL